jgi:hypothetical protein
MVSRSLGPPQPPTPHIHPECPGRLGHSVRRQVRQPPQSTTAQPHAKAIAAIFLVKKRRQQHQLHCHCSKVRLQHNLMAHCPQTRHGHVAQVTHPYDWATVLHQRNNKHKVGMARHACCHPRRKRTPGANGRRSRHDAKHGKGADAIRQSPCLSSKPRAPPRTQPAREPGGTRYAALCSNQPYTAGRWRVRPPCSPARDRQRCGPWSLPKPESQVHGRLWGEGFDGSVAQTTGKGLPP